MTKEINSTEQSALLLPERHLNLMQIIKDMNAPDSDRTIAKVIQETGKRKQDYWHIHETVDGLKSEEITEDLEYLHLTGFLYIKEDKILFTKRAVSLYNSLEKGKILSAPNDITIKLGDFQILSLDRENPMNPFTKLHQAYIRYNGMMPKGNKSVMIFEIGRYDENKHTQKGHPYYLPETGKMIDCRVDTYGRRVKLEIVKASPLEIKVKDLIERQTAVND